LRNLTWLPALFLLAGLAASAEAAGGLNLFLNSPRAVYAEEEEVRLDLMIEAEADRSVSFQYLQPKEDGFLFVGGEWRLEVRVNGVTVPEFTNHMPPEPKAGTLQLNLSPGASFSARIPFYYYYYPFELPADFEVRLHYDGSVSNPVRFQVRRTEGRPVAGGWLINGDFRSGRDFPLGWRLTGDRVRWEKEPPALRLTLDRATAEGPGLWVYSTFQELKAPAEFTLKVRARSQGQEIIVFVEGWGLVAGRRRLLERNECFMHPAGTESADYRTAAVFRNPQVRWLRVKVYTYLKVGDIRFESVDLVQKE